MNALKQMCMTALVAMAFLWSYAPASAQTAEWNTYAARVRAGIDALKTGELQSALGLFEDALRYHETGAEAHLGIGIVYFHRHDDAASERELLRTVELDRANKTAYQYLGELYYRKDDLEAALSSWDKALELQPDDEQLKAKIAKIRKEHGAERDFNRDATSHFSIKYEGRERAETGRIVLKILEDAYSEIGRALSFYPDRDISVILYSNDQFRDVTDAPGWSGGIYDGKIRIPIGGIEQETPGLRRMLYHEYTHAVVRAITPRCPTWLNEGLAQYLEGRDLAAHQHTIKQLARSGSLPSLASLEGSFLGLGDKQASQAYMISLSAVRHIANAFGLYRIRMILDEMASGADGQHAIGRGLALSYEEFELGWRRSLE